MSIILLVFLALMSLDVFDEGLGFWPTVLGLFMHNIPVFVMLAVLLIAWKREIVGAAFFLFCGALYVFLVMRSGNDWRMQLAWSLQIGGFAFAIGGLFLANWLKKQKTK